MQASKVSISPEHLRFAKMTHAKKTKLRKQNIIDLINSRPFGEPIAIKEFAEVTQMSSPSAASLIKGMVKKGKISRNEVNRLRISYAVNGNPETVGPSAQVTKSTSESDTITHQTVDFPQATLSDYARDYAWESNDDSLRGFVKWMDGKELDLRRLISGGGGY